MSLVCCLLIPLQRLGIILRHPSSYSLSSSLQARDKGYILLFCGLVEWLDELRLGGDSHYLTGGHVGLQFLPLAPKADTPEQAQYLLRQKNVEINNGRLAMLGIASFFAAETIPGSVPFIPKVGGAAAVKAAAVVAPAAAAAVEAATSAM